MAPSGPPPMNNAPIGAADYNAEMRNPRQPSDPFPLALDWVDAYFALDEDGRVRWRMRPIRAPFAKYLAIFNSRFGNKYAGSGSGSRARVSVENEKYSVQRIAYCLTHRCGLPGDVCIDGWRGPGSAADSDRPDPLSAVKREMRQRLHAQAEDEAWARAEREQAQPVAELKTSLLDLFVAAAPSMLRKPDYAFSHPASVEQTALLQRLNSMKLGQRHDAIAGLNATLAGLGLGSLAA